jgi:hypothetical protein
MRQLPLPIKGVGGSLVRKLVHKLVWLKPRLRNIAIVTRNTPKNWFQMNSESAIDFGTMLDAVNTNKFSGGINPVEDTVIAHPEFAESRQILRHPHEPPMHHGGGVLRQPLNLTFDACANRSVQSSELRVGFAAYFDLVGHGR